MGLSHAQAAKELGCIISGVSDLSTERMVQGCSELGLESVPQYADYRELLASDIEVDIVVIATTADTHATIVCDAAACGISYILCEKPMATSLEDCMKMLNACEQNGSALAINHPMRFMPRYRVVEDCLSSSPFGSLSNMHVMGGAFGMAMNGSHYIEACSFLTKSHPCEVTAWISTTLSNPRGGQFDHWSGQAQIRYKNNSKLFIDADQKQGHGMTTTYATQFGYIFVDELAGEVNASVRETEFLERPMTQYGLPSQKIQKNFKAFDNVECSKAILKAFIETDNYPSGEVGLRAVQSLVAMHYSSEHNHIGVMLDDPRLPFDKRFAWA